MNRTDWQYLALVRIEEAQALVRGVPPRPDGAYYLAGYAVESALKAAIAKLNNQHDWPEKSFVLECHTHNIKELVRLARLEKERKTDSSANPAFDRNWNVVQDWSDQSRYERHDLGKALKMIDAVANSINGVLPWIKARW